MNLLRMRIVICIALASLFVVASASALAFDEPKDETKPPAPMNGTADKPVDEEKKDGEKKDNEKKDSPGEKSDAKPPNAPGPATRIDPAAELLGRLKPERLQTLAEMIEQDWPDRPEWAEMALAVMRGQAMQTGTGWWRATEKKYSWTWLKCKYDKNSDNMIQREEIDDPSPHMDLFFGRLDRDLDRKIAPADFDFSVSQGANPAALKSRMIEYLFFRWDSDTNGQVTKEEIAKFFERADREKMSFLTTEDMLEALQDEPLQPSADSAGPSSSQLFSMFLAGQLGWFEEGPKLGDKAPDFSLSTHDLSRTISLSGLPERKPVVVIFGSFT